MLPRNFLAVPFLLLAVCVPFAAAQNAGHGPTPDQLSPRHFDAFWLGMRVDLGPDWLFSPDDNPAYASPIYDDSGWKTISANKRLTDYGIRNIPYAWYRIHVHVNPRRHDLAVEVQYIAGSYELYVNGVRIGANGKMVGMLKSGQNYLTAYDIPDSMIAPNGDLVIAIRFAISKMDNITPGTSTPLTADCIFLTNREATARDASYEATHQIATYFSLFGLNLVVGIVAFALYMAMRSQPEYLAISIALLATSLQSAVTIWSHLHAATTTDDFLTWIAIGIVGVANIEFVRLIARLRRTRWLLALEITVFLSCFIPPLDYSALWTGYSAFVSYYIPSLTSASLLPALLIWSARRGNRDARFFIPPFAFIGFLNVWNALGGIFFIFHLALKIPPIPYLHLAGYGFSLWDVWTIIYCVTMLLFLVLRTIGIARERAQAAAELEAARTTQQLLLSRSSQLTPGFHVESVYYPASEVGGDFFLVSSSPNCGLIAIVGDVSGKGLIAAMRVAMILGVLRREDSWQPAKVLHNLNEALQTPGQPGFTTACCIHIEPDGHYTLANAGHVSPYIDGHEVETPPSLPLGLATDQLYATVSGTLAPEQKLVLLSDGVVEARSTTGELLGFDRLTTLTLKAAQEIADTAKSFGQDDDITVLTLARTA